MRNPTRRNRNIGTAKSGHGVNNRLTIPERWSDFSIYWERLSSFVPVKRTVNTHSITFLIEPTRPGFFHHCTVDDVQRVLELLPKEYVQYIDLVVFRQPTSKQAKLSPVWGRLGYWSEIGKYSGPGIFIEAQPTNLSMKWRKHLNPDDIEDLERYRHAGFQIKSHSRGFNISTTPESIRAKQLYYTVPHEIGHYVDYLEFSDKHDCGDDDRFWELYGAKPKHEKEVFANRYADKFRQDMEGKNLFPFSPMNNKEEIRADNLSPEWFITTQISE